jgi:hypothetical protein
MRCLYRAAVATLCGLLVLLTTTSIAAATSREGVLSFVPAQGHPGDAFVVRATGDLSCTGSYVLVFETAAHTTLGAPEGGSWSSKVPEGLEARQYKVILYCDFVGVRAFEETTRLASGTFEVLPEVEPVEVPGLKGLELDDARDALAGVDLELGKVSGGEGTVVRQSPAAGRAVPPGTPVDVVLGEVVVTRVPVPNLVGSTVHEAQVKLKPLALRLVGASGNGRIATQEPAPGALVLPNTAVRVTMRTVVDPSSPTPTRTTRSPSPSPTTSSTSVSPTPPVSSGGSAAADEDDPAQPGRWILLGASGGVGGLLMLTAAVLLGHAANKARERHWIRKHVHAVPKAGDADPSELRADPRFPSTAIRLEPHQDAGTHVLEEEERR